MGPTGLFRRVLLCCIISVTLLISNKISCAATGTILEYIPCILTSARNGNDPPPPPPPPPPPDGAGHDYIQSWNGTDTCLQCHRTEAEEVFGSVHYQWLGRTPYMESGPETQGKLDVGVNSYCINTTGNWEGCSSCHVGLGEKPSTTQSLAQLRNIDCLICHQDKYKRKRENGKFVPDTQNMTISMVEAAKTVHRPTRNSCLRCHAKGGGGDNFKRGDLAMAHGSTTDSDFDVHMATTGANLSCGSCHHTKNHLIAGKGSDLRPTELDMEMNCTDCHTDKGDPNGHDSSTIGNHVARVSCQTCHIARYARNAADTAASEETEIHRDWLKPHETSSGAIHPSSTMAGNLLPEYRWWNGRSTNYNLFDKAEVDPVTGRIPTSRPSGSVNDNNAKLYPFKYKTARQPIATQLNELIALDTSVYFTSGDAEAATISGLENMGYSRSTSFDWIETDTFQLITHEVMPASDALSCNDCHDSTSRMDLPGQLGYDLKGPQSSVCTQCHGMENGNFSYTWMHREHVNGEGFDCSWCHTFSRPERRLR